MKTVSINVMNLCVPCENRCRYCLLSYDGREHGVDFERSVAYAGRFYHWLKENKPEISFLFGFGYSMEHPDLLNAIRFCQSIGSVTGEFLQFDGMKFRTEPELDTFLAGLKTQGIKLIDLTFYGTEIYHDRFAARYGDFALMINTLKAANRVGLDVSISIPLTHENVYQIEDLLDILEQFRTARIACFIPHGEGRGKYLENIRLTAEDFRTLTDRAKGLLNRDRFREEKEWIRTAPPHPENRVLTVTLTPDNIDFFENQGFEETIAYLEELDDMYYRAVPSFETLMNLYGDREGTKLYSARDLYLLYQRKYIEDSKLNVYDVNDERQCFVRRF